MFWCSHRDLLFSEARVYSLRRSMQRMSSSNKTTSCVHCIAMNRFKSIQAKNTEHCSVLWCGHRDLLFSEARVYSLRRSMQRMSSSNKTTSCVHCIAMNRFKSIQAKNTEHCSVLWCGHRDLLFSEARVYSLRRSMQRMSSSNKTTSCVHCIAMNRFKSIQAKNTERCSVFWCGHRDLNPDVVDIRPSNVRVCQFRHNRINSIVII